MLWTHLFAHCKSGEDCKRMSKTMHTRHFEQIIPTFLHPPILLDPKNEQTQTKTYTNWTHRATRPMVPISSCLSNPISGEPSFNRSASSERSSFEVKSKNKSQQLLPNPGQPRGLLQNLEKAKAKPDFTRKSEVYPRAPFLLLSRYLRVRNELT